MAGPSTPPVTSALPPGDRPDHLSDMSDDEAALAALGYKQEFKVKANYTDLHPDGDADTHDSANSPRGRHSQSVLRLWVCYRVLRRLCGTELAMVGQAC